MMIDLILDNIRSCHNVGSIFRTADGLGIRHIYCVGITPHPQIENDPRLPHVAQRAHRQIAKTALGAEETMSFSRHDEITELFNKNDQLVVALEQADTSIRLDTFRYEGDITLILGNEPNGIQEKTLQQCDSIIEIPMKGSKESFNVSVAAGICMYQLSLQE
jgi:tRNA G18 (ribose-2'-O)-methylase SpoU